MPIAQKPWWEWSALVVGVIGGLKSMIDVIDRIFQRPRLIGDIEQAQIVPRWPVDIGDKWGYLFAYVYAVNKKAHYTTVRRWDLAVRCDDIAFTVHEETINKAAEEWAKMVLPKCKPDKCNALSDRARYFEQRRGVEGWLCFPVSFDQEAKMKKGAELRVIATDATGREHKLKPYPYMESPDAE